MTPDTEKKICGVIVTSNTGMKDGHACFNKRPCPIHTPDTEENHEHDFQTLYPTGKTMCIECGDFPPDTEWDTRIIDGVQYVHGEKVAQLLTSRDTYWKERVEAVRRDLKARMAHEDYTECVTCDETLHHVDTLLDNLK